MGDDRPTVYPEDGRWVYRASGFGRCTTALALGRAGLDAEPWPDWFQQRLDEGTEYEDEILQLYEKEYDATILEPQQVVELEVGGNLIRGHTDGLEDSKEGDHEDVLVVDAKKFRDVLWEKIVKCSTAAKVAETFPEYAWQLSCYMVGLGLERGRLVIGHMAVDEDGEAEGIDDLHVVTFDAPPFSKRQIGARMAKIERMAAHYEKSKEVPVCDRTDYPCPFYYMHEEPEVVESNDDRLEKAATQYRNGMEYEKKGKELKSGARPVIEEVFDEAGEEVLATGSWIVKDTVRQGREYFDVDAAVEAGDVSEEVREKWTKRAKDSRYPTIKPKE